MFNTSFFLSKLKFKRNNGIKFDKKKCHTNESIDKRIETLIGELPIPPRRTQHKYIPCSRSGNLLFVSGHLPYRAPNYYSTEHLIVGKVGKDITTEEASEAAKSCIVSILGTLKAHTNGWDHIKKIVRLQGYVNCTESYEDISKVIDGASTILIDILGEEKAMHSRTAIGVSSLPFNVPVEVDMIVELDDQFA